MSQPSIFWWQKYGTLAQMAQACVALLGFVAILFQINEIRSSNRAVSARQAFLAQRSFAIDQAPRTCRSSITTGGREAEFIRRLRSAWFTCASPKPYPPISTASA